MEEAKRKLLAVIEREAKRLEDWLGNERDDQSDPPEELKDWELMYWATTNEVALNEPGVLRERAEWVAKKLNQGGWRVRYADDVWQEQIGGRWTDIPLPDLFEISHAFFPLSVPGTALAEEWVALQGEKGNGGTQT